MKAVSVNWQLDVRQIFQLSCPLRQRSKATRALAAVRFHCHSPLRSGQTWQRAMHDATPRASSRVQQPHHLVMVIKALVLWKHKHYRACAFAVPAVDSTRKQQVKQDKCKMQLVNGTWKHRAGWQQLQLNDKFRNSKYSEGFNTWIASAIHKLFRISNNLFTPTRPKATIGKKPHRACQASGASSRFLCSMVQKLVYQNAAFDAAVPAQSSTFSSS